MPKLESDLAYLAATVHRARSEAGLSLAQLARSLRVSKSYVSKLENGRSRPSAAMVSQLARVLDLDQERLQLFAGYVPRGLLAELIEADERDVSYVSEPMARYEAGAQATTLPASITKGTLAAYELVKGDCFDWLKKREPNTVHAVVTDPPYGLKEFTEQEKTKLREKRGGVWRIPPRIGGHLRSPLPRFTVLTKADLMNLRDFFSEWARLILHVLVPGGHVFIATNPLVSHHLYGALEAAGLEKRGEIIRLVQTLRGGDRPKNAHREFADVTVMPRSSWEPWGLFRKPCEGRVQDNLRAWRTGGLRRPSTLQPFTDVIKSSPTRAAEREIAPHPALKPQAFMRQIVRASLPFGEGIVLDPFMGAGSTIAAAAHLGYQSIGVELDDEYFRAATNAIPKLARLQPQENGVLNGSNSEQRSLFVP